MRVYALLLAGAAGLSLRQELPDKTCANGRAGIAEGTTYVRTAALRFSDHGDRFLAALSRRFCVTCVHTCDELMDMLPTLCSNRDIGAM